MSVTFYPYLTSVEKLQQSTLSNQLEGLGDEIDVTSLNFQVTGLRAQSLNRVVTNVRESVTAASITRTTQGASVLEVELTDPDLELLNSGLFGGDITLIPDSGSALTQGVVFKQWLDCEIDGLFFRMVSVDKPNPTERTLTLQFEDREVNVLRSYPPLSALPNDPNPHAYKLFDAINSRTDVIRSLVAEAKDFGPAGPRLVIRVNGDDGSSPTTAPQKPDPVKRQVAHHPGFPPSQANEVTVKTVRATSTQLTVLDEVLACGWSLGGAARTTPLLQTAVMVVTQESDAGANLGHDADAIGVFQQDPRYRPTWAASGDVTTDAKSFFDALIPVYNANPNATPALLASLVQRPYAFSISHTDPTGKAYDQWAEEALRTVTVWSGQSENVPDPRGGSALVKTSGKGLVSQGQFKRGSMLTSEGGAVIVTREDNWRCITRLCSEVGWLCYCVSGTIFVEDWDHVNPQQVRCHAAEGDDGIDGISIEIDTGMANATATVQCRISRWGAPPGTLASLGNVGPGSGRWVVQTIERDLFSTSGTITLTKPQLSLIDAESSTPTQSAIVILSQSGTKAAAQADAALKYAQSAAAVPSGSFVFYDQGDARWASDGIYNDGDTIGADGCGPTSAAMVIATLRGIPVTPIDTGLYMSTHGGFVAGEGASTAGLTAVCNLYGLTTTQLGTDFTAAARVINDGGYVIAGGQGNAPFTSGGHVVVFRAVRNGAFIVANPAGSISNPSSGFPAPVSGTMYMIGVTK